MTNTTNKVLISNYQGQPTAHILLSDGSTALLDVDDYQSLIERDVSPNWTVSSDGRGKAYLKVRHEKKLCLVVRLILNASKDVAVTYINGDTRDLRKSNLKIIKRHRKNTPSVDETWLQIVSNVNPSQIATR